MTLALDCASSEFYKDGKYDLAGEGKVFDAEGFGDYLAQLCENYPIVSIEDGMDESDWDGWASLTRKVGDKVQLVGRRPVRDQHQNPQAWHRQRHRQLHPD